jgi:Ankyrin repeats (many copies)
VASGARSSVYTSETVSNDVREDNESLYSVKNFSFTNDLLTAPVYKRLVLNMMRRPKTVQVSSVVSPSLATVRIQKLAPVPMTTKAQSSRGSIFTVVEWQPAASPDGGWLGVHKPDVLDLIGDAAGENFSPSTVSDLEKLPFEPLTSFAMSKTFKAIMKCSKYLPLQATLKREQKTSEERHKVDLQLFDATRCGSLDEVAVLLDDGADINAVSPDDVNTPLHVAMSPDHDEQLVLFLLQYKNVNVHARDGRGRTLLHEAVRYEKLQAIRWLLALGLSGTDGDENCITPFNIATQVSTFSNSMSMLLEHARMQGASVDEIEQMDPSALHTACQRNPTFRDHALVLLHYGWSPAKRFLNDDDGKSEPTSPLYLAVLKKEIVLVEKMLLLPKNVVRVNGLHGPCPNLLTLAMDDTVRCSKIVLLLLRAGIDYEDYWDNLKEFARWEGDAALLKLLHDMEMLRRSFVQDEDAQGLGWSYPIPGPEALLQESMLKFEDAPSTMLISVTEDHYIDRRHPSVTGTNVQIKPRNGMADPGVISKWSRLPRLNTHIQTPFKKGDTPPPAPSES